MEWLKDKCRAFRRYFLGTSFSQSLLFYCLMGILGAAAANSFLGYLSDSWLMVIVRRYGGLQVISGVEWSDIDWIAFPDRWMIRLMLFIRDFGVYVFFLGAMLLVIRIYHRQKVYPVLSAVTELVENVEDGEYFRPVSYHGEDEMGSICAQADRIRRVLAREKSRQQDEEEQLRRINAAFAHDIRTPLTVIKGYTEFLEKYLPQGKLTERQVLEKLATIREQEERLLSFTGTMTTIQNLEKREVCRRQVMMKDWMDALQKSLEGLGRSTKLVLEAEYLPPAQAQPGYPHAEPGPDAGKKLYAEPGLDAGKGLHAEPGPDAGKGLHAEPGPDAGKELYADQELMLEALENIWSNALRYAEHRVVTSVKREGSFLICFIQDDGPGFSDRALLRASEAYYREGTAEGGHFGLGLTISRILCERHGGGLTVVNSVEGGAIVSASFRVE